MNKYLFLQIVILIFFGSIRKVYSTEKVEIYAIDTINVSINNLVLESQNDLIDTTYKKDNGYLKKKLITAITAFPFPLGFVGAHRVLLGTKPWVPVVYVCTFGGVFGLLPLIDFCVILFSKDIEQYENNPNIFMWVK